MTDASNENPDISALEQSIQEQIQKLNAEEMNSTAQQTVQSSHAESGWWSVADAMTISSCVLIFGLVVMVLATALLYKGKKADDILKLFGTIIIVISAIFLVVAGYTDTQIAPVIGLLGTIAGYLLGRSENEKNDRDK